MRGRLTVGALRVSHIRSFPFAPLRVRMTIGGSAVSALVAKEWRELAASRAALLFAAALGPLVGHAFGTAVRAYAEASGAAGGPAALAQGLSPLDGIVVPTLGAYALAAALLFPFVVIRLVSAEKESGALRLLLQAPVGAGTQLAVKAAALLAAWLLAWTPGLLALALWRAYGGHLDAAETLAVLLGHLLRGALVVAVGALAAAVTESAASAAVVALAATLGTWALDFAAQVNGGALQRVAQYTPDAALRAIERGELPLDVALVVAAAAGGLLALAAVWLHPGRPRAVRWARSAALLAALGVALPAAARARASADATEDRRNSFSPADERALRAVRAPLGVTVHLAPEDPRLADLERGVLRKLRRTLPDVDVRYAASTSTGLFERPGENYGEVWYELRGRRAMQRSTTEPIVLETIYGLAGIAPPAPDDGPAYPGHPLRAEPRGAAWLFYAAWPLGVALLWLWRRRAAPRAR